MRIVPIRRYLFRSGILAAAMLAAVVVLPVRAQQYPQLTRPDFTQVIGPAPGASLGSGFNDRQNSWAWSMAWFKGKLYVGTARAYHCMEQAAVNLGLFGLIPYPPPDADILCPGAPDIASLPLQAEIWRWDPASNLWARVYQSPADVPIPSRPGRFVARDVGYRGALVFREPDGSEALYFSGVSSKFIYGNTGGARIIRTSDGVNFSAVPQSTGTFLASLNNTSFRGMAQLNGKFYVVAGSIVGQGVLLESSNPSQGNNSFRQVSPPGMQVYEIEAYNNALYLGNYDVKGYSVAKLTPTATLPYPVQTIIPEGAYYTFFPNRNVISFGIFNDRLYVGTNAVQSLAGAELLRINPDDSWQLVSGVVRPTTPVGRIEPISGLSPGFGNALNKHIWRQQVFDGRLYVGTFDMSTIWKDDAFLKGLLAPEMGGDLWVTTDGAYFTLVDKQGFQDKFNFGFRSFASTPYGLFTGTANFYYGLQIYRGVPAGMNTNSASLLSLSAIAPAERLDVENTFGKMLLAWEPSPNAKRYQIFRSSVATQSNLGDTTIESGQNTFKLDTVSVPSGFVQIGTTTGRTFKDVSASPFSQYIYYVVADDGGSRLSVKSNLSFFPSFATPTTFSSLNVLMRNVLGRSAVAGSAALSKFTSSSIEAAKTAAIQDKNAAPLQDLLSNVRQVRATGPTAAERIAAQDLDLALGRLVKRVHLYIAGHLASWDL